MAQSTAVISPRKSSHRVPILPAPPSAEADSRRRAGPRLLAIGGLVVIALGGALTAGTLPRLEAHRRLETNAAVSAAQPPRVTVATAHYQEPSAERILPGNSLPLMEAALFARSTGFVKQRLVDIGDRVEAGQLLAEISAPDIDDQLAEAQANVVQAKATLALNEANARLATITLDRSEKIRKNLPYTVTQQEIDQEQATVGTTSASVESSRATIQVNEAIVRRYTDLQDFQKITAPFTGVITARNVEKGDLISADSTTRELFHLMRTDVLRVFVNVPQTFATGIQPGQSAIVYRRDDPRTQYTGKVTRTADALDPTSRTLLTQVEVPNPKNALRPGMYLQVKFVFDRKILPLMIPTSALVTRTEGPQVAILDDQQRVHYRAIELGRDYGSEVQVVGGLKEGETVVVHPGDELPEGTVVETVAPPK